jgi:hypothetical protein
MAARVPPTLTEELRIQLGEIGWTPEMTCAVLDAADYDSAGFAEDIRLIRILARPVRVRLPRLQLPIRLAMGCDCAMCVEATLDGVASFIPNAQGRESYMPIDFLYHALKWNVSDVDAFFDKKRRSIRLREKRILSQAQ